MKTETLKKSSDVYFVVHPLDDVQEEKRRADELGPMTMTRSVRWSLFALRAYLVVMLVLVALRVFALNAMLNH